MDLRCPNCNSTDLKKVSVAYEEGLFRSDARMRIRGVLVGSGGPDIVVGRAATKATNQTALSKRLSPPKKWSYVRLIVWFVVVSFVALVVYIHAVMANSSATSSLPVKLYGLIGSSVFGCLALLTWRHNRVTFERKHGIWNRCFVCMCCGNVTD